MARKSHPAAAKVVAGQETVVTETAGSSRISGPALPPPSSSAQLLGEAVFLAMKSPDHRALSLTDIEARLIPPILLGQFRLWRTDKQPIAFATWAMTDDPDTSAFPVTPPAAAQWRSGSHPVIIDMIAPFGGKEGFVRDLGEKVFEQAQAAAVG